MYDTVSGHTLALFHLSTVSVKRFVDGVSERLNVIKFKPTI